MIKLLRRTLWTVLALLLLLAAAAVWLLATHSGGSALFALAQRALPALSVGRVDGALTGPLTLHDLRYTAGGLDVALREARFDWRPRRLAGGRLVIDELRATGATVRLPPPDPDAPEPEPSGPLTLPDIVLPLGVDIDALVLEDVELYPPGATGDDQPLRLRRLRLALHSDDGGALRIDALTLAAAFGDSALDASLDGTLTPAGSYPLDVDLAWTLRDPRAGELRGGGRIDGALADTLTLSHDLAGAASATLDARVNAALSAPSWELTLTLDGADLTRIDPRLADVAPRVTLYSEGALDGFKMTASAAATLPELGAVDAELVANGSLNAVELKTLTLDAADAPLALSFSGRADLDGGELRADGRWRELTWPLTGPAEVASPEGTFTLSGTLDDYRAALAARVAGPAFGSVDVALDARGSDRDAVLDALTLRVPERDETLLTLDGRVDFADLSGELNGRWQALGWPLDAPTPAYASPSGTLRAEGSPQRYSARIDAALDGAELVPLQAALRVAGSDRAATLESLSLGPAAARSAADGPRRADSADAASDDGAGGPRLHARADVTFDGLRFNAAGDWSGLVWPLAAAAPDYASPSGRFRADGSADDYTFTLDAAVAGSALPQGRWQLQGQGSAERLARFSLAGDTLGGRFDATGSAAWAPALSWQLDADGETLNPGLQWPQLPGEISFALNSRGTLPLPPAPVDGQYFDDVLDGDALRGLDASVTLASLSGSLGGQALDGRAALQLDGRVVAIDALRLRAGDAELVADGRIDERLALNWTLDVPALGALLPGAGGAISSRGALRGTPQKPQASLSLAVDRLSYPDAELALARLDGDAQIDLSDGARSTLTLNGRDLSVAGQRWQTLALDAAGTPANHTLEAAAAGDLGAFRAALRGAAELDGEPRWRGRLTTLRADGTPAGSWALREPTALSLSAAAAELARACLDSRPTTLCLDAGWNAAGGARVALALDELDPGRFAALLPPELAVDSRIDAAIDARLAADGRVDADGRVALGQGELRLLRDGETVRIGIDGGALTLNADGERATAEFDLDLGALGGVDGRVALEELSGARRVDGRLQAALRDLALVEKFVPQLQAVKGRLDADLLLSGALPVPTLGGRLTLSDAAAQVPEAGIVVDAIEVALSGDGSGVLTLTGSARSGPGRLTLNGQIDPLSGNVDVAIGGERFEVVDAFNANVLISPALDVAFADGAVRVGGELTIPQAELGAPEGVDSAVGASQDVVIISAEDPERAAGVDVFANVRVILGDAVFVRVAGFDGQLTGDLRIEQSPRLAPRGTGSVEVVAGDYRIYGQDLTIERGRVLFSGGPLDNPGLDLRVARSYDDVTAGAQVSGTLREPRLTLFSDPPMPDSSVLSYIVFGKPSDGNSLSENALLAQAVSALNTGTGATSKLSSALGLDTLSFDGGADDASLTVGKYLSPDLYVSYGIGLFDALNTFSLRYQINDRFRLESSSNANKSSADLVYSVER